MVFLSGPRQVGKTYLSKQLLKGTIGSYLSWDSLLDRKKMREHDWRNEKGLVVFDELHKMHRWKNWIKGVYDTRMSPLEILVTGSARLNVFRRGGDSLMGRYRHVRLHPYTCRELVEFEKKTPTAAVKLLWDHGGFPEPLFASDPLDVVLWRKERLERLLREDVFSLEQVRNLSALEHLVYLLEGRVGSTISYKSLAEDLDVSPLTVKAWIQLLENLYLIFVVRPFTKASNRAIKKEPKVYLYDYSSIENEGARFENMIAAHLLKTAHFMEDTQGKKTELCYIRDKEKNEVDFVLLENRKPLQLVECKLSDTHASPALLRYSEHLNSTPCVQVIQKPIQKFEKGSYRLLSAEDFLMEWF